MTDRSVKQTESTSAADCCSPVIETTAATISHMNSGINRCPECGARGKGVDIQTVKAMLAVSLESLQASEYRFCRTTTCPVVYFSADGVEIFTEEDLRERVHQKAPEDDDVYVCYCFRHTPGSIRDELLATGESTVVVHITAGVQAGQCACEIRNPQGSCCLGNVSAVVKRIEEERQPIPA